MNRAEMRLRVRHNVSELVYDDPADEDYDPELSGNFWKDSFINDALNDGIKKFSREERWDWLWQTESNIAVPANTLTVALRPEVQIGRHAYLTLYEAALWDEATTYSLSSQVFWNGQTWKNTGSVASLDEEPGVSDDWVPDSGVASHLLTKVSTGEGLRLRHSRFNAPQLPEVWFPSKTNIDTKTTSVSLVPVPGRVYSAELHYVGNPDELADDATEPDIPEAYQPAIVAWATMQCWVKEKDSGKAAEALGMYESILEDARNELLKQGRGEAITWGRPAATRRLTDSDWFRRHIPGRLG